MNYQKTATNQLKAKPRKCLRCDEPTLFTSSIDGLKGKPICPTCERTLEERLSYGSKNKRSKKLSKRCSQCPGGVSRNGHHMHRRGLRGSNQYQTRYGINWLLIALTLLLGVLMWLALTSALSARDKSLVDSTAPKADAAFISPLPARQAEPEVVSPTPSPTLPEPEGDLADFLRRVHRKESSSGRNTNPNALHNLCKSQSKSNEYGYGGMAMMICFDNHEEATARVARWYEEHRAGRTEAQTYCWYAYGKTMDTCDYWEEVRAW